MKKHLCTSLFIFHFSLFTLLSAQNISTVVGNTVSGGVFGGGYSGDGGAATAAELHAPYSVAFDRSGNMYIDDQVNQVIREVDHSTGNISTIAGNNAEGSGYSGDGGPAIAAELYNPTGIAVDTIGNLFIADAHNNIIRKVDHSSGYISTIAGNYSFGAGYSGDGGYATSAELNVPSDVSVDDSGNIYISDGANNVIRKVNHTSALISTIAGNHIAGYNGDGNPATNAELNTPTGVSVDMGGNIFIADNNNQVVRKVYYSSGIISTVAGKHSYGFGYSGDGGPATNAELYYPWGIKVDGTGNLFIADQFNSVIREVYNSNGDINTIAGNNGAVFGYTGDGGPATDAELYAPAGVAIDAGGNLLIADADNNVVREVGSVTIGINKITSSSDAVNVYPNPGNGEFTIHLSVVSRQSSAVVYNVFGEKVFSAPSLSPPGVRGISSAFQINLGAQPNGVYFLQIITEQGSICKRLVIAK